MNIFRASEDFFSNLVFSITEPFTHLVCKKNQGSTSYYQHFEHAHVKRNGKTGISLHCQATKQKRSWTSPRLSFVGDSLVSWWWGIYSFLLKTDCIVSVTELTSEYVCMLTDLKQPRTAEFRLEGAFTLVFLVQVQELKLTAFSKSSIMVEWLKHGIGGVRYEGWLLYSGHDGCE